VSTSPMQAMKMNGRNADPFLRSMRESISVSTLTLRKGHITCRVTVTF